MSLCCNGWIGSSVDCKRQIADCKLVKGETGVTAMVSVRERSPLEWEGRSLIWLCVGTILLFLFSFCAEIRVAFRAGAA
jgi:hypothetical protein